MYDYIALRIDSNPCNETITDLLAAFLIEKDFETFEPDVKGLTAYVRKDNYKPAAISEILNDFPIECSFRVSEQIIKGEDWNKEWEQNYFKPIQISDQLLIRSSFHDDFPKVPIEIIIDPKMAFGTGHHATTAGMSRMLLLDKIEGKTVIDMGTGTGILSILVKKLGASRTVGIDIDEFAIQNAVENGKLNHVDIEWRVGDDKTLQDLIPADIFLANINLNVITENLDKYVKKLNRNGKLYLSGFLFTDREKIIQETKRYGLNLSNEYEDNNWMVMVFEKP